MAPAAAGPTISSATCWAGWSPTSACPPQRSKRKSTFLPRRYHDNRRQDAEHLGHGPEDRAQVVLRLDQLARHVDHGSGCGVRPPRRQDGPTLDPCPLAVRLGDVAVVVVARNAVPPRPVHVLVEV